MDSSGNDHIHLVLSSMVRKLIAEVARIRASREFLLEVSIEKPPFEKEAKNKRSFRPFRPRTKRKQFM